MIPGPLPPNIAISVVSPAGPPDSTLLGRGLKRLRTRYDCVLTQSRPDGVGYLAAGDEARRRAFQEALDDSRIGAVIASRGGYGSSRIIDELCFDKLLHSPKWVIGSSDLTAVLFHLWCHFGLVSIHGPMAIGLANAVPEDWHALMGILAGEKWMAPEGMTGIRSGRATGPLIGGNLTVLAHMMGTIPHRAADGAILFLEDVGESPYRLDRCLIQLKRSHLLDGIKGFVLGEFVDCDPAHGIRAGEAIEDILAPLGVPIAAGYPAAHGIRNYPFIHGRSVTLEIDSSNNVLLF